MNSILGSLCEDYVNMYFKSKPYKQELIVETLAVFLGISNEQVKKYLNSLQEKTQNEV